MTHGVISGCLTVNYCCRICQGRQQTFLNMPSIPTSLTAEMGNTISSHYIKNSEIQYSITFVNLSVKQLVCQIVYM